MSKKYWKLVCAVSTALAAMTTQAQTSADNVHVLDESVVSATGYEQDTREAPASISVTTAKELSGKPVTDLGTAVGDIPGVNISQTKMGNANISIRGFDAAYTLIMVDGKRQNNSAAMTENGFDPTSAFMPPVGMIERIEVLRGPASVAWGSDAVGGVVNVITKRHPNAFTGSFSLDATLQEHDEYANRAGTNFYLGVPLKENVMSLTLRGRYQDADRTTVKTPNGQYASHSSTESYLGNFGARLNITPDTQNYYYIDGDFTRFQGGSMQTSGNGIQSRHWYHKYGGIIGHEGTYDFGTTEAYFQLNGLQLLRTETKLNPWSGAQAEASESHGSIGDPLRSTWTYTAAAKGVMPVDFDDMGAMTISGGLEVNYETFQNNDTTTPIRGKKLDQTIISAFLENEYFLSDEWIATLGGRGMWSNIFGSHFAPRGYLVWRPAEGISFKGGIAAGYKTPNVKLLTDGIYQNGSTGDSYGNPDLKPEESWSYELSTTLDLLSSAQLTVGGFYTDFKNMIASEALNQNDTRAINYGKVETKGIEVLLKTLPIHGISYSLGYTYTDAEIKEGAQKGQRPNELPRHALTNRFDYESGPFSVYVKSVSKFDMVVTSVKGTPKSGKYDDYTVVDAGASYQFTKNHRISVALNNIFDKDMTKWVEGQKTGQWANAYCDYVEGRNLWFSYNYSF